jgi:hypothetical protein
LCRSKDGSISARELLAVCNQRCLALLESTASVVSREMVKSA